VYQPKYLSLGEAARHVSDHLAQAKPKLYADAAAAFDAACKQLVQALYDGAIRSEGVSWDITQPDQNEFLTDAPLNRIQIFKQLWSNEKTHEITEDERGKRSELDFVSVGWGNNSVYYEDEWEEPCLYQCVRLRRIDMDRAFRSSTGRLSSGSLDGGQSSFGAADQHGGGVITYTTDAPGRPSSMHLVEGEMRRRIDCGEQALTMTAEAKHLSSWLRTTHPGAARPTPKTIQNQLGRLFRELKTKVPK
jgi:hypothetical protein